MKQYDIWLADIPAPKDSHVQHGRRPVVIISNDLANTHSPVVTVIPLTIWTLELCWWGKIGAAHGMPEPQQLCGIYRQ